jgi:hypothetical protein
MNINICYSLNIKNRRSANEIARDQENCKDEGHSYNKHKKGRTHSGGPEG